MARRLGDTSQLMGRVGAALAQALDPTAAATRVRTLRIVLPTPEAVLVVTQLAKTTSLFENVRSVELNVESGAVGTCQDGMEGTGGRELAQLLRALSPQSHPPQQQSSWVEFSFLHREASSASSSAGSGDSSVRPSLLSSYTGGRSPWDDATVAALADLLRSRAWRRISLDFVDLTSCSARSRQGLWASLETSAASLQVLCVKGTQPAQELISTGRLRAFSALTSVDVGCTHLDEDAVVELFQGLHTGIGGWWRLQHLGLSQCDVTDAVVTVMATQLRTHRQEQQEHEMRASSSPMDQSISATLHTKAEDKREGSSNNDDNGAEAAAEEEEEEVQLTSLDVSGSHLSRTAAFTLAGCLVACTHLTYVNTRHCRLQADGVAHLAAALQHATELRTWVLCLNRFADAGMAAVAKYGKFWPCLTELDLTRCRLTCAGVRSLCAALPAWDGLEVLRLVGNDLRCPAKKEDAGGEAPLVGASSAFAKAEEKKDTGSAGLFAYDPAYMKCHGGSQRVPTSFELDRRDRAEGRRRYRGTEAFLRAAADAAAAEAAQTPLERLGEALSLCLRLRLVDVSDCSLADEGLRQLTRHYAGGERLTELRLAANPLFTSVSGLDTLVELLRKTPQLAHLDLSFTGLGDLGLSMLCDGTSGAEDGVLACMTALETLQLARCSLQSLGWESLTAALPRWPALRHIALHHNIVSEEALLRSFLQQVAETAPQLESVGLIGCLADQRAAQRMANSEECRVLRQRGVQLHL